MANSKLNEYTSNVALSGPIPILAALLFCGCAPVKMYVNLANGTNGKIGVKSSETGQELEISAGHFKKFMHSSGDLTIKTEQGVNIRFEHIQPPTIKYPYRESRAAFAFISGKVVLNLSLQSDLEIYALLPGKTVVDEKIEQPEGYPKKGQIELYK